jgi:hypothetical protein
MASPEEVRDLIRDGCDSIAVALSKQRQRIARLEAALRDSLEGYRRYHASLGRHGCGCSEDGGVRCGHAQAIESHEKALKEAVDE